MKRTTSFSTSVLAPMICLSASVGLSVRSFAAEPGDAPPKDGPQRSMVGSVEYKMLETRDATEARIMGLLFPDGPHWGGWYRMVGFPYASAPGKNLAAPCAPEEELAKMGAGGPGPDLSKAYTGKRDTTLSWTPIGAAVNRAVDLAVFDQPEMNENVSGYLYCPVTAPKDMTVDVTMGSDDGLRLWFNGRVVVDADVPRSLDPNDNKVRLDLKKGVNHLLAKVSNGRFDYQFQINTHPALDPTADAQLQYYLNADFPRTNEDAYYRVVTLPVPPEIVLEVGGLDTLPRTEHGARDGLGRPMVCSRRGDVFLIENAYHEPPSDVKFKKFASGLHEPLGLVARVEDGKTVAYCVQRGELTKLLDTDADDVADQYLVVSNAWGVSGNYHEFAFGPKFDREGNAWVTLNVGFCGALGKSIVPWRGWSLKISPTGEVTPWSDGLRSPNGIGEWTDGTMFYLDNQGDFVGTNRLSPLLKGSFAGHPATLRWREGWTDGQTPPPIAPAAVWFPYKKMGQSVADFLLAPPTKDGTDRFGPFAGQVFVGDQTNCLVNRVTIEKIDGVYQGACYPFRESLQCGVNRLAWGSDGSMFVGQTDRGWGSIGRTRFGVERLVWTGKIPFELREMRVKPDGFELEFTRDVDQASAGDAASYRMTSYTYEHHQTYGSDEMDTKTLTIESAEVTAPRTVHLKVVGLRAGGMGYVHELTMPGVKAASAPGEASSLPLLHGVAYYTVQRVPR